jgi:hypothetical protein
LPFPGIEANVCVKEWAGGASRPKEASHSGERRKIPGVSTMLQLALPARVSERYSGFGRHMRLVSVKQPSPLVIGAVIAAGVIIEALAAKATLVEVWVGGDDGLTQRLRDATEHAFQSSPRFVLSSGKKIGTLIVTIPTHVRWKQFGTRTQVSYSVEFASTDQQNLGTGKGSCWDDDFATCAAHIVRTAEVAARRIPH